MDDTTPEERLEEKLRNRRYQLEDYQQTLSGARDFLTDGFVQAQQERKAAAASLPAAPAAPLVTVEQTTLPIIRAETQQGTSIPVAPAQPPLSFSTVSSRICLADGSVAVVNLMCQP